MCGRAVQTKTSLQSAESIFIHYFPSNHNLRRNKDRGTDVVTSSLPIQQRSSDDCSYCKLDDNLNLSPGMKCIVFSKGLHVENGPTICMQEKVWGIIPHSGTINSPLDEGASKHFSNMMYNARSDTLYEKKTYRDLAIRGNTCIWVIDGFFEWKQPVKNVLSTCRTKQPYFVRRRDGLPLLVPGLWKSVKTGRKCEQSQEDLVLDTFTHLTTNACAPLHWLHHRQPVFLLDSKFATEWIINPSQGLVNEMSLLASAITEKDCFLEWHPVTKSMSKVNYRDTDSVEPIKIQTVPSVKSFFLGGMNNCGKIKTATKKGNLKVVTEVKHHTDRKRKYFRDQVLSPSLSQSIPKKESQGGSQDSFKRVKISKCEIEERKACITDFFKSK